MSKRDSSYTRFGTCEYCNTYCMTLSLIKITKQGSLVWTSKDKNFYTQSFWSCNTCLFGLTRLGAEYHKCEFTFKEEEIEENLLKNGSLRDSLIRKIKPLEEIFPDDIDGIYIIPPDNLPNRFKDKTNIMVSFKNLSILQYYRYVIDRDECIMNTWNDYTDRGPASFASKAKFWGTKLTRILMALGRIHAQSDMISVWVWADTRILSIEFFCKNPVCMIQASPEKILRVI